MSGSSLLYSILLIASLKKVMYSYCRVCIFKHLGWIGKGCLLFVFVEVYELQVFIIAFLETDEFDNTAFCRTWKNSQKNYNFDSSACIIISLNEKS